MSKKRSAQEVLHRVRRLLVSGQVGEALAAGQGAVGQPLIVCHPRGDPHSWLVPLTRGDRLVGYLQLDRELVLIRQVSFQRRPDSLEGVPYAADWLDPDRVLRRAAEFAMPNEDLGKPVLTYDCLPDRVAWRVKARSPAGEIRDIMVAGSSVWERDESEDTDGCPEVPVRP